MLALLAPNTLEVHSINGEGSVGSLALPTTRSFKDAEGIRQTETEWHRITCFNGVGKSVAAHVTKGAMAMVTGRIHYSKWTDKNSKDCYGCEIIAEQVDFLAKAKESTPEPSETSETKTTKRRWK